MPAVHRRVEEVVRGLLERGQHENGLSHLGHSETGDPQDLSLGVDIVGSDKKNKARRQSIQSARVTESASRTVKCFPH